MYDLYWSSGSKTTRIMFDVLIISFHFQHGYTFLAEARTTLSSLASGKFRLRVIGSTESLPSPEGDSVNTHFVTKEIKDYYMPHKDRILLRYALMTIVNERILLISLLPQN